MIRILSHGKENKDIEKTICWECGCAFEYSLLDRKWPSQYDSKDAPPMVKCPDCGQPLFISWEKDKDGFQIVLNGPEKGRKKPEFIDLMKKCPFLIANDPIVYRDEEAGKWHLLCIGDGIVITIEGESREEVIKKWNARRNEE